MPEYSGSDAGCVNLMRFNGGAETETDGSTSVPSSPPFSGSSAEQRITEKDGGAWITTETKNASTPVAEQDDEAAAVEDEGGDDEDADIEEDGTEARS